MRFLLSMTLVGGLAACGGTKTGIDEHLTDAPVAMLTSHTNGDEVGAGNTITFSGFVTDVDNEIDELRTTWWAGGELVCDEATPADDGFTLCAIEIPSGAALEVRLDVVDSRTLGASDKVSVQIVPAAAPNVTIDVPLNNSTVSEGVAISFLATLSDADSTLTELSTWWVVDGERLDGAWSVASSGTVAGDLEALTLGEHTLDLWAQDPEGNSDYDSVTITVIPANTNPSCAITSPEEGATGRVGATVVLTAEVDDAEQSADTLDVVWTSSIDTDFALSASPGSDGVASVTTDALSQNAHSLSVTVTDASGATCVDVVSLKVGETPSVAIESPTDDATFGPEDLIVFEGIVNDDETSPESIVVSWIADFDGAVLCEGDAPTSTGITRCNVYASALSDIEQTIRLRATDEDGLYDEAIVRIQVSRLGAPLVESVSIAPDPAVAGDALTCSWSGFYSPDGGSDTSSLTWTQDGVEVGTTATVSGDFIRGDVLVCTVTPTDSEGEMGTPMSGSLTISNTPPSIADLTIEPASASVLSTLSFTATLTDADDDPVTTDALWTYEDGTTIGHGPTLDLVGRGLAVGTWLHLIVTPSDGVDEGISADAWVELQNARPEITDISLSPTNPTTDDTIVAVVTASDADEDPVSVHHAWYVNSTLVPGVTGDTLDGTLYFDRDDEIYVVATPSDAGGDGASQTSETLLVLNTPPTAPVVTITPATPTCAVDLVCTVDEESTDADGDIVDNTMSWTVDGVAFEVDEADSEDGSTVLAIYTSCGEEWVCTVTPNDGFVDGTPGWDAVTPELVTPGWDAETTLDLADYGFVGESGTALSGNAVSSAGDVDGDGLDDILIGEYYSAAGAGKGHAGNSYLFLGKNLGESGTVGLSASDYKFIGEEGGDQSGHAVADAGDVDGDGLADILIGAYQNDEAGDSAGKAYLFLGKSLSDIRAINLISANYSFIGEGVGHLAGGAVASAGDVDGDGLDDILISARQAPGTTTEAGKTYLFLGASLGDTEIIDLGDADYIFLGASWMGHSGHSVSTAGDVDGDGLSDIFIGEPKGSAGGTEAGAAYIILGSSLGVDTEISLDDADYRFIGETGGDEAGASVADAGDVDGDGLTDLLIGAKESSDFEAFAGKVYLVLASRLGDTVDIDLEDADFAFVGESGGERAGKSVSTAGDVDGDGHSDLLISAYKNSDAGSSAGKTYVILGASLMHTPISVLYAADYAFLGEAASDVSGGSVSDAGDVNGDGLGDILIGATENDEGAGRGGKTYLLMP